jgi:hypothetical protein
MATKKVQMIPPGFTDVIHPETDADIVNIADAGGYFDSNNVEEALQELGSEKINHSLATAVNDFLVASGVGVFVKKTLAEVKTILGLGTAAYTASTAYATAAQGTLATNAMPKSGGTFTGDVVVENDTNYGTSKVRNSSAGTADPGVLANGAIYFKYIA